MKPGRFAAYIVAFLIGVGVMFAINRKSDENIKRHNFDVPTIEIYAYGGQGAPNSEKMLISCMQYKGCDMEEVLRVFNKYGIPAKESETSADPDCIDIPGDYPFFSMEISHTGSAKFEYSPESEVSIWTMEDIATELYWAH